MGGSRKQASVEAEGEGTRGEWGDDLPPSSTSLHGQEQKASVEAEGEGTRGEWGEDFPPSSTSLHGQEQKASVEAEGEGTRGEQWHGKSRGSTTRVQIAHRTPAR